MFPPDDWFNLLKLIMATENSLQNYELMLILTPVLSDEEYKNTQKKYADFIKENGGSIVHHEVWGLRSLAYPIAKKTTGLYYVLEYKAPTETNAKLEIQMNRDEAIMRHMVTRIDKYAEAYNIRKRNKNSAVENAS